MLKIENLRVTIGDYVVAEVEALEVANGKRIGFVGESGSGKSMIVMSIIGLQPKSARVTGSIMFEGVQLVGLPDRKMAKIRGRLIGLVPQDPTRSLNPTMRVGKQISEAISLHSNQSNHEINRRVRELIDYVRLPEPERIIKSYPHQLSGGQQQRVLIAMAIACRPLLLIADEPTTALDVTVQGEILRLLVDLSEQLDMGLLFVSHELGVVRFVCDDVAVIYGGQVVEFGPKDAVIGRPIHRYTEALISANIVIPSGTESVPIRLKKLRVIKGSVPSLGGFPEGCRFRKRCEYEVPACNVPVAMRIAEKGHSYRCCNPNEYKRSPNADH